MPHVGLCCRQSIPISCFARVLLCQEVLVGNPGVCCPQFEMYEKQLQGGVGSQEDFDKWAGAESNLVKVDFEKLKQLQVSNGLPEAQVDHQLFN